MYTPEDTVVVGGNFLHSYSVKTQLEVADIEIRQKVPLKYRFPFFCATNWFAALHYAEIIVANRTHFFHSSFS